MSLDYSPSQLQIIRDWLGTGSINVFGLPFSGKDTQAKRLGELLEAPVLGGGDILRGSKIPATVKKQMDTGNLAPTEEYMKIVLPFLSQDKFAKGPLLLSSVGRWQGEEAGVLAATDAATHPIKAVVVLSVLEEVVWKRWEEAQKLQDRGERVDDALEIIDNRLQEFRHKTIPVIEYYRDRDLVIEVNGDQPPDDVTRDLIQQLALRASTDTA